MRTPAPRDLVHELAVGPLLRQDEVGELADERRVAGIGARAGDLGEGDGGQRRRADLDDVVRADAPVDAARAERAVAQEARRAERLAAELAVVEEPRRLRHEVRGAGVPRPVVPGPALVRRRVHEVAKMAVGRDAARQVVSRFAHAVAHVVVGQGRAVDAAGLALARRPSARCGCARPPRARGPPADARPSCSDARATTSGTSTPRPRLSDSRLSP